MSRDSKPHPLSWLGVGVGTAAICAAIGTVLGAAWFFESQKTKTPRSTSLRRPTSSSRSRFTLTRAQLPKTHFKFLITKDHKLSKDYRDFLSQIFQLADSDHDGGLSPDDLQSLVILVKGDPIGPEQLDWYFETFETNASGDLTLEGFLRSYEWPMISNLPMDDVARAYQEEIISFGCTCDSWIET